MTTNHELKRQWPDKIMWPAGITITIYLTGPLVLREPSVYNIVVSLCYVSFFAWGSWIAFTKPDAQIINDKMFLFEWLQSKPTVVRVTEINSVKRHSETPIWRVPPLRFYLKDGSTITFSTGANERRMKRIINFIESETTVRIEK